ncbi:hypothetical protein [Kitasatospora brasiliensis]|uniref:hypothetical protein n=1 Tax=Kitasatospora brasiliensis TaxID=3058040 RepID=UPI0029307E1E|nr:hypothetical protein [Kitasatospora sp. K002]
MTTQGERTQTPGEGRVDRAEQRVGGGADPEGDKGRGRRLTGRRAAGWIVLVGVVAAGGWIITRPMPGDYIPGLGPSTKDSARTPKVVGAPPPPTDPGALNVDNLFPAQRVVEVGGYKARRNGVRQGENCAEVLQDRAQDPLKDTGCQSYLTVSFTGQDHPVLSSVTMLRFPDQATAARAADALRAKPGAVAFILADTTTATAQPAGAKPGGEPRVETVGHYVTVTSSRPGDARPASTTTAPAPGPTPAAPTPTAPGTGGEPDLDEATRALSYAAGQPFVWM